jgi:hypothetical protein
VDFHVVSKYVVGFSMPPKGPHLKNPIPELGKSFLPSLLLEFFDTDPQL